MNRFIASHAIGWIKWFLLQCAANIENAHFSQIFIAIPSDVRKTIATCVSTWERPESMSTRFKQVNRICALHAFVNRRQITITAICIRAGHTHSIFPEIYCVSFVILLLFHKVPIDFVFLNPCCHLFNLQKDGNLCNEPAHGVPHS